MVALTVTLLRLARLTYPSVRTDSSRFSDVPADRWSARSIAIARAAGIASQGDGKFRPENFVSRAETVTMLHHAIVIFEKAVGPVASPGTATYSDIAGHWSETSIRATTAIRGAAAPCWSNGAEFGPDATAARDWTIGALVRTLAAMRQGL